MYVSIIGDISNTSQMMIILGALVKGILVKYWIFCCCFMFFFVSFSDKVAVYKILYICLFLFFVVLYEVSYNQVLTFFQTRDSWSIFSDNL